LADILPETNGKAKLALWRRDGTRANHALGCPLQVRLPVGSILDTHLLKLGDFRIGGRAIMSDRFLYRGLLSHHFLSLVRNLTKRVSGQAARNIDGKPPNSDGWLIHSLVPDSCASHQR
jgi:hypothetical protein